MRRFFAFDTISKVYWVSTGLMLVWLVGMGAACLLHSSFAVDAITQLGYPRYFLTLLGFAKLLELAAKVLPVGRTLREWAYAGVFFELAAAVFSYLASGAPLWDVIPPLTTLLIVAASYLSWRVRVAAERDEGHTGQPVIHIA